MKQHLIALLCCLCLSSAVQALTIVHDPLTELDFKNPSPIEVLLDQLTDEERAANPEVIIHYKAKGETFYNEQALNLLTQDIYQGTLALEYSENDLHDYFISVMINGQTVATFPENNPERFPFEIAIKGQPKLVTTYVPRLLAPEPNTTFNESISSILIGIEDEAKQLDPSKIELMVNNVNVTAYANLSRTFINYSPDVPFAEGRYDILLKTTSIEGVEKTDKWTFIIEKAQIKESLKLNGRVRWESRYYQTGRPKNLVTRAEFENRLYTDIFMDSEHWNTHIHTKIDGRESQNLQPLNRFSVSIHDRKKYHKMTLGDSNPKLSQLTINGLYMRGIDVETDVLKLFGKPRTLQFRYIGGQSKRAIKVSSANNITVGTFEQDISGGQMTLRAGSARHKLTYLYVKDDASSLSEAERGGAAPKENYVLSLQNQFRLFDVTQVDLETAGAIFYSNHLANYVDISDLNLPVASSTAKKITDIFPPKSSMSFGLASYLNVTTPLPFEGLSVIGQAKWVQPGFNTLGNIGIQKDILEYGSFVNYRLLNNRMTMRYGLRKQNNNVLGEDIPTVYTDTMQFQSSYSLNQMGAINVGFNNSIRQNLNADGSAVTGSARINNKIDNFNLGYTGLPLNMGSLKSLLNLSLSYTKFNDSVTSQNSFDNTGYGASLVTKVIGTKLTLGFSESVKKDNDTFKSTTTFTNYNVKLNRQLIPKRLIGYVSSRFSTGRNHGSDSLKALSNQRTTLSGGLVYSIKEYKMIKNSKLNLSIEHVELSDKRDESQAKNFEESTLLFKYSGEF